MQLEIWRFFAGLGFFLYGMGQMEIILKNVSGRSVKLFLNRNTGNLFKSIAGGTIITGIVQSSSVVSLIVLVFVESGIITFKNAMGVILGTNLGTTLSSWLVATVGFNVDILSYSLPVIAVTSIGMFFSSKRKNLFSLFGVFFSLGILFLGLAFMKEGALVLVKNIDLQIFSKYGTIVFVLIGFVLTTIIQSSSATVAITLTALFAGVVTFPLATAVVIGSEVGTTIKIVLWGITGSADKKRVAWGNFIYNITTATLAYIFMNQLIYFIQKIIKIEDPIIGLVFFQSSINLIAILIFMPFLNKLTSWLEGKFIEDKNHPKSFISKELPFLPILVTEAFKKESLTLFNETKHFVKTILEHKKNEETGFLANIKSLTKIDKNNKIAYERIKNSEGDLLEYYYKIQGQNLSKNDTEILFHYVHVVRQTVFAAKAIKDIEHDLIEFEKSTNDALTDYLVSISKDWNEFELKLTDFQKNIEKSTFTNQIENELISIKNSEQNQKNQTMTLLRKDKLNEIEASTMLNVNKEIFSSKKSLLMALREMETETLTA
jgi:phosphate:Na+ symporter